MSFFGKLKQGLGIGGVKVVLEIPPEASKDTGIVKGTVILITKSPQQVKSIKVLMREVMTSGARIEDRREEQFKLGDTTVNQAFAIHPGEEKRIEFSLPFAARRTFSENLQQKGGVVGAIGTAGRMMDDRRSRYYIVAQVEVEGTVLGPSATQSIRLA